jgi:hypothetical protein
MIRGSIADYRLGLSKCQILRTRVAALVFAGAAGVLVSSTLAPAETPPDRLRKDCSTLSAAQIRAAGVNAKTQASLEPAKKATSFEALTQWAVLPGGSRTTVWLTGLTAPPMPNQIYCARLVEDDLPVGVIATPLKDDPSKSELTLSAPDMPFGPQRKRKLVLVSYTLSDGRFDPDTPCVFAQEWFAVSDGLFSFVVALCVVLLAYVVSVLALGRVGNAYSWNPVYLTSDRSDRASLSQLQIYCFTLIVFGLLTYGLLRIALLSEISGDVLQLLGISAAGAAGANVAEQMKKRLSYDNWAWLRNHGWLTAYESGVGQPADTSRARWGDLLKTNGDFDVYSFQLAVFSLVVAYALLTADIEHLATFTIPANLKALLGLSNVVYIGGKAINPGSVAELDKKVTDLRSAELSWLGQVDTIVRPLADGAKLSAAIAAAPEKYRAYIGLAREAARLLTAQYGVKGTTFIGEPINDALLLPALP